jgi:hypothetical protein
MLATALGMVTAIALLSGCTYGRYDRYAYGYGNYYDRGYYGRSYYDRYGYAQGAGCWLDPYGYRQCASP